MNIHFMLYSAKSNVSRGIITTKQCVRVACAHVRISNRDSGFVSRQNGCRKCKQALLSPG